MALPDGLLLGLLLWLAVQGWMVVRLAREVRALARLQVALATRQQALDAAVGRQPGGSPEETLPCEDDAPS